MVNYMHYFLRYRCGSRRHSFSLDKRNRLKLFMSINKCVAQTNGFQTHIESLTSVYIILYGVHRSRISNSCHFFPVVCVIFRYQPNIILSQLTIIILKSHFHQQLTQIHFRRVYSTATIIITHEK